MTAAKTKQIAAVTKTFGEKAGQLKALTDTANKLVADLEVYERDFVRATSALAAATKNQVVAEAAF